MVDYLPYIIICVVVLLVLAIFILRRKLKSMKVPQEIPQDIVNDFNRAEELTLKYKGTRTPQQILWQINEERGHLYTLKKDEYKDADELYKQKIEAMEMLSRGNPVHDNSNLNIPTQPKPKLNLRNLFRRKQ